MARLRERQEELVLCCNDAVKTQIGWTLRDILHSLEALIFERKFESMHQFIASSQWISQRTEFDLDIQGLYKSPNKWPYITLSYII